jgi:hypothetical protein
MDTTQFKESGRHEVRWKSRPGVPELRQLFATGASLTNYEIRAHLGLQYRSAVTKLLDVLLRHGEIVREGDQFRRTARFREDLLVSTINLPATETLSSIAET